MSHPRVTEATRLEVLEAAHWQCEYVDPKTGLRCTHSATETAHRIAQTEANASTVRRMWKDRYGEDLTLAQAWVWLIHHRCNLAASCSTHNPKFNCGNNPGKCWEVLIKIRKEERLSLAG